MRRLIYVPMIHSKESLKDDFSNEDLKKVADVSLPDLKEFYDAVGKALIGLNIEKPRIYIEGYFEKPREIESDPSFSPTELSEDTIPELRAFFSAFSKGGRIETTEDKDLYEERLELVGS